MAGNDPRFGEFVGPWYTWWPGDPLPALPALAGFAAAPIADDAAFAHVSGLSAAEIAARRANGDRPYLATVAGAGVGWGWSATRQLSIGELGIERALPPTDRYLWAFETLPEWRGRGVYPRLLQVIPAPRGGGGRALVDRSRSGERRLGARHRQGGFLSGRCDPSRAEWRLSADPRWPARPRADRCAAPRGHGADRGAALTGGDAPHRERA